MKVWRGIIADAETGAIYSVDAVEYQEKLWIVPAWLESPTEGYKRPARIICLDTLKHQRFPAGDRLGDFLLADPIPKSVLAGESQPQSTGGYVVIENPPIRIPIPRGIH